MRYEGFFKSSPISKKGKISYLLSDPFPEEEIILGKTKDDVLRFIYKGIGRPYTISKGIINIRTGKNIAISTIRQHLEELKEKKLAYKPKNSKNIEIEGAEWEITDKGKFLIEKCVGFPVKSSHKRKLRGGDLKTYPNSGHGYTYAIKPDQKINFRKILDNLKIPYELVTHGKTIPRIIHNGKKVWFNDNQNKITFWFEEEDEGRYPHKTPLKSRASAELELFEDMEDLMKKLKIEFSYRYKNTRVHNGDLNDERAKFFVSKKRKVFIYDDKGEWLRYDYSRKKYPEREVTRDDENLTVATAFQKFENMNKKDGFVTARPDNLKKRFHEIKENFNETDERIKKLSEQNLQLSQVLEQMNSNQVKIIKFMAKDKK